MKMYIEAKSSMKNGSYVVDRNGTIYNIGMHVPSTTYLGRGIYHLALTDADFLLSQGLINEKEATAIVLYCYIEFLKNECGITDPNEIIPLIKLTEFSSYAETRYAPKARNIFFKQNLRTIGEIEDLMKSLPDFETLNNKWYNYLKDNYCKISKFGDVVEFRISSDDFDWNPVIIDKVIMKYDSGKPYSTRYNIMKESDRGYQSYFENATLEDILQNDKVVLSSEYFDRKVVKGQVKYMKKRIVGSTHRRNDNITLEEWCKTLPEKIHTLYMHESNGKILGKFGVKDAAEKFGDCSVTGSYSDGDGQISVWILNK